MNGNPRDSTPDIGAYEFGGTPPPTCSQLGGNVCQQGQACEGGNFQYSSDHGFLCCVGGTCSTPPPPPGGTDGDVNGDGVVDLQDLTIIAIHYGSTSGFPPGADQNNDGIVDVIDLTIVATHYGASGGGSGDGFLPGAIIEAEEGTLESPMQTVTGNGASGSYVHTPTANQGKVSYTFQISTPGQYSLDVKERSPSQGANSFFIGLDGEQANGNNYYVYDSQESSSFIWDPISLRGPTGTFDHSDFDPMVWQLSAGEHTFHFYGREYQTGIDQLRLIPSGLPVGDCIPGETESCSTGLQGICAQGTKTCGADGYWGSCVAPDPETEICGDDLDSDCDGNINNGCEGICDTDQDFHDEFFWCIGGGPNDDCNDDDPTIYPGHAETCDGKDNDCDGAIDEGCVSSSSVSRQMTSNSVDPGQVIIVKLQVIISDPTHEESFYAIEETVPQGWTVLNAGGGTLTENVIRWATLQSAQTTLYTYSVKAPTSSATYSFVGNYFIQGMNAPETIPGDSLVTVTQPQQYCSDQTLYGQCSNNQPLFCQDGDLMNNCQACGCPSGETCNGDGGCLG